MKYILTLKPLESATPDAIRIRRLLKLKLPNHRKRREQIMSTYEMRLMRRLLHEGLHVQNDHRDYLHVADDLMESIGLVPSVLAMHSPFNLETNVEYLGEFPTHIGGIAEPFSEFWCEGAGPAGSLWGNLIRFAKDPNGPGKIMQAAIVTASALIRPTLAGVLVSQLSDTDDWSLSKCRGFSPYQESDFGNTPPPSEYFSHRANLMLFNHLPALELIQTMSCRNIGLETVECDRAITKRLDKHHKPPKGGYRFHVLVVKPLSFRRRGADEPAANSGSMPLHLCRGSYAVYGPDKPLFGRYIGRFWRRPHCKGNGDNGVVAKDYVIR